MRPASIVNFERLYLGAIILGVISFFLAWDQTLAMLQTQTQGAFGDSLLYAVVVISLGLQLLLWYLIAKRASVVAKWILIVWIGIGLIGLIGNLGSGTMPNPLSTMLTLATTVLQLLAVWMLFRPDARSWFAGGTEESGTIIS